MSDAPTNNLNGERITTARLTVPYYGTWVADVTLALATAIPPAVTLTIGDMVMVGHVLRMASFAGSRSARIVGGFGGWPKAVAARAYRSAGGVRASMVLGDAAIEVGEQVKLATDSTLGTAYVREAGPASRVLRYLAGSLWWVDALGVTQVGARAAMAITSAFTVVAYNGGRGRFEVATEAPADWQPGRTFTSPTVSTPVRIGSVSHHVDNDGIARIEVLSAA